MILVWPICKPPYMRKSKKGVYFPLSESPHFAPILQLFKQFHPSNYSFLYAKSTLFDGSFPYLSSKTKNVVYPGPRALR